MRDAMTSRDFGKWVNDSWTHRLFLYAAVVLTASLVVQVIATVFLGTD